MVGSWDMLRLWLVEIAIVGPAFVDNDWLKLAGDSGQAELLVS